LPPGRFSVNGDDGNLNYDDGDLFSNAFKITSEMSSQHTATPVRSCAPYFYDFENAHRDVLSDLAKEKVGSEFKLLDASPSTISRSATPHDGSVRFGRQVVSWGESTFIQNGINVVNPIDVSKLRVAGAELKEAFLPVDMLWASFAITENLSMEGLYLLEFEETEPDPAGTYFSTNDFATSAATFVMLGFGRRRAGEQSPGLFWACAPYGRWCEHGRAVTPMPPALVLRPAFAAHPDRFASDNGQYGAALRYFSPELNEHRVRLLLPQLPQPPAAAVGRRGDQQRNQFSAA
jgi:hypothetical protein